MTRVFSGCARPSAPGCRRHLAKGVTGGKFRVQATRFQVSAQPRPPAAETASLIGKETENEHRTSNVQHRTPNQCILSVLWQGLSHTPHTHWRCGSETTSRNWTRFRDVELSPADAGKPSVSDDMFFRSRFLCSSFHSMLDVRCSMFNVHL
jgi:hypothetical protein